MSEFPRPPDPQPVKPPEQTTSLIPEHWLIADLPKQVWLYIAGTLLLLVTAAAVYQGIKDDLSVFPVQDYIQTLLVIALGGLVVGVVPTIVNYFIPRRIELKPNKICIYHPYEFIFVNLADLTQIRPPRLLESLHCLKAKNAVVLIGPGRKKTIIEPELFKEPDHARATLADCLRPRLRHLAARPPKSIIYYPDPLNFLLAAGVIVFFLIFSKILALPLAILVSVLILLPSLVLKSKRAVFKPDGIQLKSLRNPTFIPYEKVKTLDFRIKNGRELVTLRDQHDHYLLSFSSDHFDYPHIRNFLVLYCKNAHMSGDPGHKSLNLCAFDIPLRQVNQEPNPEPYHPKANEVEPDSANHLTLRDQP